MGTNKKPFYRIVVADQRCSRGGRFIDIVGTYDTRKNPPAVVLDVEKTKQWLGNGAQPSDTARSILVSQGLMEHLADTTVEAKAAAARAAAKAAAKAAAPAAEAEAAPAAEAAAEPAASEG